MRVIISAPTVVTLQDDEEDDPVSEEVLRSLDGLVYEDDDEFFTDYLCDGPEDSKETALAEHLEQSGKLRLVFKEDLKQIWVETEYLTKRELTQGELETLAEYTIDQWTDGIGSNFNQLYEGIEDYWVDFAPDDEPVEPTIEQLPKR